MNLNLTSDQNILKETTRRFLEKEYPPNKIKEVVGEEKQPVRELWKKISDLGWLGLDLPEIYGGFGGSFLDVCVLLREMGRVCLPSPFFSTGIVGKYAVLEACNEDQKKDLLPGLAEGKTIVTLAMNEEGSNWTSMGLKTRAEKRDDCYLINGNKFLVLDLDVADFLIVAACNEGPGKTGNEASLFWVDANSDGLKMDRLSSVFSEKLWTVNFENVNVPLENIMGNPGKGKQYLDKMLLKATTAQCAEAVGGAEKVLEMTVAYAKEREQFNKPIGSFQAIQFYCADMLMEVKAAELAAFQTAWKIDQGLPAMEDVATAKACVSRAYQRVCYLAHKIHGAIGFTEELNLHFFIKRANRDRFLFGDQNFQMEIIADSLGL